MSRRIASSLVIMAVAAAVMSADPTTGRPTPVLVHRGTNGIEALFLTEQEGDAHCYAVVDPAAKQAAIVDPGARSGRCMSDWLEARGIEPTFVLITHAHSDHVGGLEDLLKRTRAVVVTHRVEFERFPSYCRISGKSGPGAYDRRFLFRTDEQVIEFGRVHLRALLIPGHTLASLAYELIGEDIVFTGDTLLSGSIGRTDLPGSAGEACLVAYVKAKLMTLNDSTRILPGHGAFTTVGRERATNPFVGTERKSRDRDPTETR